MHNNTGDDTLDTLLHAISGVLTLILMGLIGCVLAELGWINDTNKSILPKLINYVSLPLFFVYNITHTFSHDQLLHLIKGSIVPFISIAICFILSIIAAHFMAPKGRRGIFQSSFTTSNVIFVGLPVTMALFGEEAIPYTLLYFFANTTFFWTLGNASIQSDSANFSYKKILTLSTLKRIFSPPILGFLISLIILIIDIPLPKFFLDTAQYMGNLTTPLALIFIGVTLHSMGLKKLRFDFSLSGICIGRFIIAPLSMFILAHIFPMPELMYKVFVIMASLPAMVQTVVLSSLYQTDPEYATLVVSSTTLLSIITIPIYMVLLS